MTAEGEGVEPQWLTRPLDRLTGGVQHRLETPSNATYHEEILAACPFTETILHKLKLELFLNWENDGHTHAQAAELCSA